MQMVRRSFLALTAALTVILLVPTSQVRAQILGTTGGGLDPFSFYYGYYLPHQAAIAAQPTPLDTVNQITALRQYNAVTDRAGLYDPISPYGDDELDPLRPGSALGKGERLARPQNFARATSNSQGTGPALYYNRTARYYPSMRSGRGPNRNIGTTRSSRGGGMGGGVPSMGMPGVR
jgi:hypothetical protein